MRTLHKEQPTAKRACKASGAAAAQLQHGQPGCTVRPWLVGRGGGGGLLPALLAQVHDRVCRGAVPPAAREDARFAVLHTQTRREQHGAVVLEGGAQVGV